MHKAYSELTSFSFYGEALMASLVNCEEMVETAESLNLPRNESFNNQSDSKLVRLLNIL